MILHTKYFSNKNKNVENPLTNFRFFQSSKQVQTREQLNICMEIILVFTLYDLATF